ncbi:MULTISPECIES: hypothetical protein [Buttiauxella]|jgi:ACS family hexuronate transporter-like MFS transporter|uniref:hypothetical protein n=1 Tax=Buttiauxella TaxID=82976 RepID=UPI0012ED4726|nr:MULTISPECIES: hypothetical protein [Buttiauxella]
MKVKKLRWIIVGLIGLAAVINYIDHSALPVMLPCISALVPLTLISEFFSSEIKSVEK